MSKYKRGDNIVFDYGSGTQAGNVSAVLPIAATTSYQTYIVEVNSIGWIPTNSIAAKYSLSPESRYLYLREEIIIS